MIINSKYYTKRNIKPETNEMQGQWKWLNHKLERITKQNKVKDPRKED